MEIKRKKQSVFRGKTYSLFGNSDSTGTYYSLIGRLADLFLQRCPDEKKLLLQVQNAGGTGFLRRVSGKGSDKKVVSFIKTTLRDSLSEYTAGVKQHLKSLPVSKRIDGILRTREEQYHLFMVEIELVNRMNKKDFSDSGYKFALLGHCLRDFRPGCRATPGDIEYICRGCTDGCLVNLGGLLLTKHNIRPYISVTMDLKDLFKRIRAEHPNAGALGIACVPELVGGMRLCMRMGIPPVGIPLDANRCARWTGTAKESSFSIEELENLLR